jgi:hypothetical protein
MHPTYGQVSINTKPYHIKVKSLEELQNEARIRNDKKADELCKNIGLCIGWSYRVVYCFIYNFICNYFNYYV